MKKIAFHSKAHFYLSLLVAFFLPLARCVPIIIILLGINWLIEADFKQKFKRLATTRFGILFCSLYILYLIGLLYTDNLHSGTFDIQVKLSLLIFPLLYGSRPLKKGDLKFVFFALIAGCITCSFILLIRSIYNFTVTGDVSYFFYEPFSAYLIHPSYLAMYVNLAICWVLVQLKDSEQVFGKRTLLISLLLICYLSFIVVLLSSKLGLITLTIIYLSSFIYYCRKKYVLGLIGILLTGIIAVAIFKFVPSVAERINNSIHSLTAPTVDNADAESTTVRMLIWKASNQVIAEHPIFGSGTGDSKDVLMAEYKKRGMTGAYEHALNAHNEFYQVFVSIGLIGFIVLCAQLFLPLFVSIKEKNSIYTFFIILIILNFLPESMLESEGGVMFYGFFNSILCFSFLPKEKTINV
ncbi:MAG TPA: O-antigen ligase family protein [Bacteroidia bacterium]|nr:O-antigen ligase family protein [Bacteroidia bacterium]